MSLTIVLVGLAIGTLVGLTGVGGGSLLTPVLVWLGTPVPVAVGTDLVANAATKFFGAVQHERQRSVSWRWVAALAVGGVPAALLGTLVVGALRAEPDAGAWLKHFLGAALVLATLATILQGWLGRRGPAAGHGRPGPATWVLGAFTGFLVGLTSVGAGSLVAPILFLLSPLSPREIVGTDIASSFFVTAAAGLAHMGIGTVDGRLALNLLLGSVPGVWLGSRLTLRVPKKPLRYVISGLIIATGLRWLT